MILGAKIAQKCLILAYFREITQFDYVHFWPTVPWSKIWTLPVIYKETTDQRE